MKLSGTQIIRTILERIQECNNHKQFGPWKVTLPIPLGWMLDENYPVPVLGVSIEQRIRMLEGVQFIELGPVWEINVTEDVAVKQEFVNETRDQVRDAASQIFRRSDETKSYVEFLKLTCNQLLAHIDTMLETEAVLTRQRDKAVNDLAVYLNKRYPNHTIRCLCGSTKFKAEFERANAEMTAQGFIILAPGFYAHADGVELDGETKARLDRLHLRKIDLADDVYVINVGGYIGESTKKEIAYAVSKGVPVHYLEEDKGLPQSPVGQFTVGH
jgi:hypothetical protein